jgi:hypothetical protein
MDATLYGKILPVWLGIVIAVFTIPLVSFMPPLKKLKESTIEEADRIAIRLQRAKERKVFDRNLACSAGGDNDEDADLPDPAGFRKAATSLSTIPYSRKALLPLSAAALAPLLIVGASLLPLKDLLKAARTLLIL